jgi:xylitol oxidase
MDKRDFLKATTALTAATILSRLAPAQQPSAHRTNWAGNLTYHADHLYQPTTVAEVQDAVKKCAKLRALGSRHSFNTIADSLTNQISLEHLDTMTLDRATQTATVGAGVRYGTMAPWLDNQGFAVPNLASLPHITVAGAIATATHGSGVKNGNLATAVRALEIVTADGNLITLSRDHDGDNFLGSVVHLGAVGIVTKVTLDVIPRFDMTQVVYQNLSMNELEHNLETIMGSGYSVSLFTNWQNHNINQVWIKNRYDAAAKHVVAPLFYGAKAATKKLHPIDDHDATPCTEQLGVPGPWYERMPHFRMNFTPSSGAEIQTEYFVPRNRGYEAIMAVEQLKDKITPHLFITEIRAIAADNLWMSTAYQRDSLAIHFTWKPETAAVLALLPQIEAKLAPFDPRPHWAKVFTIPPSKIKTQYAKLPDYQSLVKQHDPLGKFRNEFIEKNIFGA